MPSPESMESQDTVPANTKDSPTIGTLLHTLSNKLVPLVVFSEIALRRCEDSTLTAQLAKIHGAAEEARDLLVEIRTLHRNFET